MKKLIKPNIISVLQKIPLADKLTASLFIVIIAITAFFFLRKGVYIYVTLSITYDESVTYQRWGKPPPWFLENLKPGIGEKNIFGEYQIQIIDTYQYDANSTNKTIDYYVILKIKSVHNKRNDQYTYKGIPIAIGSYQNLLIQNFQLKGIVTSISKEYVIPLKKLYNVKGFLDPKNNDFPVEISNDMVDISNNMMEIIITNGIPKSLSSKIIDGLSMKDTNGKDIVKIKKTIKQPATYRIPINGIFSYVPDIEREQVDLETEVLATMIDGKPFYKQNYPLLINQVIPLSLPFMNFFLTITDIEPVITNQ
jgi:hypothetical protein